MASHQLPRFSKSILEKPQLVHPDKYLEIAEVLDNRSEYLSLRKEAAAMADDIGMDNSGTRLDGLVPDSVGVLEIDGTLTARGNVFQLLCGGTSYDQLIEKTEEYVAAGKKKLLMYVSSPGGEAFKMFTTSLRIQKLAKDAGMEIIAYYDGIAASAAYGISVVADTIIAHPESHSIGSIGVIVSMLDDSKKMEKEGVRRVMVSAGKNKHPFGDDGSLKKEFIDSVQEDVDKLYDKFVSHVSANRDMTEDAIRATEASTYHAEEALSLGLVDKLMTEPELFHCLGADTFVSASELRHHYDDKKMNVASATNLNTEEKALMTDTNINPEQLAALQAQLESMQAQNEAQAAALAKFQEKELAAEKAKVVESLSGYSFLADFAGKEALADFMLAADDTGKELMNSVIEAAKLENEKVVEEAATQVAEKEEELTIANEALEEAKLEVENAKTEALSVKEEFGKGSAIEGDVKDKSITVDASSGKARTAQLAALVKQKQANK
jgi:signal peptide peptidase SppA